MIPTYVLHNRSGNLSIKTVERMIAGLNSHIFDYLLAHAEHDLKITDQVKSQNVNRLTQVDFYMNCVSLNRPCSLPGLAKSWPAFSAWDYKNNGNKYLMEKFKGEHVPVFLDDKPFGDYEGISFDETLRKELAYKDFYNHMQGNPMGTTMLNARLPAALKKDLLLPEFYKNLAEFKGFEMR
jgi:hypothetical protein